MHRVRACSNKPDANTQTNRIESKHASTQEQNSNGQHMVHDGIILGSSWDHDWWAANQQNISSIITINFVVITHHRWSLVVGIWSLVFGRWSLVSSIIVFGESTRGII